jgi:hypothetical protein
MKKENIRLGIEKKLWGEILKSGCLTLNQVSMRTGCKLQDLYEARDSLLEKEYIRSREDLKDISFPELIPYEPNV